MCISSSRKHSLFLATNRPHLFIILAAAFFLNAFAAAPGATQPVNGRYTWMLPKTLVKVTLTYSLISCKVTMKDDKATDEVDLDFKVNVDLEEVYVPDGLVGVRGIRVETLRSFWDNREVTIKTYDKSNILQYIGAKPSSQVAEIAKNLISSAAKVLSVSGAVPVFFSLDKDKRRKPEIPANAGNCGSANETRDAIAQAKKDLTQLELMLVKHLGDKSDANANELAERNKKTKELNAQISSLKEAIGALEAKHTITVTRTIDPGITPINGEGRSAADDRELGTVPENGWIAAMAPTRDDLQNYGWVKDGKKASTAGLEVNIYLGFGGAHPKCKKCNRQTSVGANTLYREVRYIPIRAYRGQPHRRPKQKLTAELLTAQPDRLIPFAQFGIARNLPLSPGLFEDLDWYVHFRASGEAYDSKFLSKSIGSALTGLLKFGSEQVNTFVTEREKAKAQDSETERLKDENALLDERIKNYEKKKKWDEINASTQP